jgi:hypothetical protein
VYVKGWCDDLWGIARKVDGFMGVETEFRRVIAHANASFGVGDGQQIVA